MNVKTNGDAIRNLSDKDIAEFLHYLCDTFYDCGKNGTECSEVNCILYNICNREEDWIKEPYNEKLFKKILDKSLIEW